MGLEDQFIPKIKLDLETLKALKIYADLKCKDNSCDTELYQYIIDSSIKQIKETPKFIKPKKNKVCHGCKIHPPQEDSVFCELCRKEDK